MKINSLLQESITAASSPENATNSAPKMGRSDKFLEDEKLEETSAGATGAGSVASVSGSVGGVQRRGKGSMFAGIKTSAKYPNSQAVKESQLDEVDPRNFDSDVDYYAARNAPARQRSAPSSYPYSQADDDAYFREIFRKKRLAAQQAEREADHERLATGTNEGLESDSELKTWQVVIFNNYYAGKYSDYRGRYYYVLASSPEEAKQVVLDNADGILQELLAMKSQNGKKILPRSSAVRITPNRIGKIEDGTVAGRMSTAGYKKMFGPQGPMMVKLSGGAVVDVQDEPHGTMGLNASLDQHADDKMKELGHKFKPVAEEQVNEKSKSQAQFRTMAAVAHNPEFAKKVGISQKVGKEFHSADKGADYKSLPKKVDEEDLNGEYDDESGSAESNLHTIARAAQGLIDTIGENENLPEWCQEKIAKVEGMLVAVWDYLESQEEQGIDPQVDEDWQKTNKQDKTDGMSPKAVKAYRRENPGSKLKTAVTKKPSELKAGSKDAKRRKSFCARMSGNKGPMKDEKGRPTPKAKALSRWNCESVEQTVQMLESVHHDLAEMKQRLDPKCWKGYKKQGTKVKGGTRVNNCVPVSEAEFNEDKLAQDLYKDLQIFKKGADKEIGPKAKDKEISSKAKDKEIIAKVTNK